MSGLWRWLMALGPDPHPPESSEGASGAWSLHFSEDLMRATLIHAPEERARDGEAPVRALLRQVVTGLDEGAVAAALERAWAAPSAAFSAVVASGTAGTAPASGELSWGYRRERSPFGELPERVSPGHTLASLVPGQPGTARIDLRGHSHPPPPPRGLRLTAGAGAHLAGQAVIADAEGYPVVRRQDGPEGALVELSIEPIVAVTADAMEARLTLWRPLEGEALPDHQALIAQAGVVRGLDHDAVNHLLAALERGAPRVSEVVARGLPAVDGEDGRLEVVMDLGPRPGRLLPDGTIDFRSRAIFEEVAAGALIAVLRRPTGGTEGFDVTGRITRQRPGRDLRLETEGDALFDRETGEVRASRAGVVSLVRAHLLRVSALQTIKGDVDYATGHIHSGGSVEIRGSVRPGFHVEAAGDVLIHGAVDSAEIRCGGNAVIRGGAKGSATRIVARGDIDLNFLEYGRAFAGGTIAVRRALLHARAHADEDLRCERGAKVVGGQLIAGGDVTVGTVGGGASALIAAGVRPGRLQRYFELFREEHARKQALDAHEGRFGIAVDDPSWRDLAAALAATRSAIHTLDLTPPEGAAPGVIEVQVQLCAGNSLRIGEAERLFDETCGPRRFTLAEEDGAYAVVDARLVERGRGREEGEPPAAVVEV
ncbi:MAG: DUF342 domain-containing protein [Deltaproteobacteria bacterium]|nr:DUF342 domain-containing protein [Deltaproteobacteria bacterium]